MPPRHGCAAAGTGCVRDDNHLSRSPKRGDTAATTVEARGCPDPRTRCHAHDGRGSSRAGGWSPVDQPAPRRTEPSPRTEAVPRRRAWRRRAPSARCVRQNFCRTPPDLFARTSAEHPPADLWLWSVFSGESASSTTASTSPASTTPGSASGTNGAAASSASAGPESPSTTTYEQLALDAPELTASPEASPARAPARSASARDSDTPRPFCGSRWPAPLASYDPATSSWRTWQTSLDSTTEKSGERSSVTWPRSGTTSSGTAYPQQPSAPLTSVTGSSPLLPTPRTSDMNGAGVHGTGGQDLRTVVSLLPTPHGMPKEGQARRPGPTGNELGRALTLLPTPDGGQGTRANAALGPRPWRSCSRGSQDGSAVRGTLVLGPSS
jgi:hypothetical protein